MRGLNIIMIGPPCSGKGTHSKLIADKLDFQHISTGEIFREEISKKTALGVLAQSLIDHGNLIPDSVTMKVLYKKKSLKQIQISFRRRSTYTTASRNIR